MSLRDQPASITEIIVTERTSNENNRLIPLTGNLFGISELFVAARRISHNNGDQCE